jgi:hypothetical protein
LAGKPGQNSRDGIDRTGKREQDGQNMTEVQGSWDRQERPDNPAGRTVMTVKLEHDILHLAMALTMGQDSPNRSVWTDRPDRSAWTGASRQNREDRLPGHDSSIRRAVDKVA